MKDIFDNYNTVDYDLDSDESWADSNLYTIEWYNNLSEEFLNEHEKLHQLMLKISSNKTNKILYNIPAKDNNIEET
jgi:tRNA A37 threonylcarbamoyladenosine biosynthesis protein TsaE